MKPETVGRPMEILLVEDSLLDARLTIAALKKTEIKHRLTLTRDGEEALHFLLREGPFTKAPRPDLILLDLHLPKKDGHEVLAALRTVSELREIPVVILTASEVEEADAQAKALSVDAYLTKPVHLDKFLGVIRKLRNCWFADVILPSM